MEDNLIIAVSAYPQLYDPSLPSYRDSGRRNAAWRKVAEIVGFTDDVCKRKWKNLRDTYLKELKKERENHTSGAGATMKQPWRFMAANHHHHHHQAAQPPSSSAPPPPVLPGWHSSQPARQAGLVGRRLGTSQPAATRPAPAATSSHLPGTSSHLPGTSSHQQPPARHQQPPARHQQPPARHQRPAGTSSHLPGTSGQQAPAATCPAPAASRHQQPPARHQRPAGTSSHLPGTSGQQAPAATCPAPAASRHQQPPARHQRPAGTSSHLPGTSGQQAPAATCPAPAASRQAIGKRRRPSEFTMFEERMIDMLETPTPQPATTAAVEDEDALFFRSLLPDLKRLPKAKKAQVKFRIHQIIYEAGEDL
ncbi:Transcription factor Adf-1 [Merluccius polli]|uniref:Transcription factor Adf-1 n=1 Tax=Merluccius polli TaxID=89951 RepID=A0AA47MM42_MERPO|nr:Transcription factor Adf-1 [Merluccius polli]